MSTIVYAFRLASPDDDTYDRVMAQMRCAHRFRNTLIEIERGRRAAERRMLLERAPSLGVLTAVAQNAEAAFEQVLVEIRKLRAQNRNRVTPEALRDKLKAARAKSKEANAALRAERKRLKEDPKIIAQRDLIKERAIELDTNARAYSGLSGLGPHYGAWGTYNLVREAASQSFSNLPLYQSDGVTPNDPSFEPWRDGAVCVQIQGGAPVDSVLAGTHPQLQITPPDERAWVAVRVDRDRPPPASPLDRMTTARGPWTVPAGEPTPPGEGDCRARRELARQAQVRMSLGTDAMGRRIYGTWRMHMHRPLPKGATVKRATIERRAVGPFHQWTLLITVADVQLRSSAAKGATIAIDIGWREIDREIRVCGWTDTEGREGELRLDAETVRMLHAPETIRSERDKALDVMRARVSAWMSECTDDVLRAASERCYQWRAPGKFRRLLEVWAGHRVAGDEVAYCALEAWDGMDLLRYRTETKWRQSAIARRTNIYREFAARVVDHYSTIVLEDFHLPDVAERPQVEEAGDNDKARSNRQLVCVHELRSAIVQAGALHGNTVVKVSCEDTTRTCPVCGLVDNRDAAASIVLACECGAAWDQDVDGAPTVLLARWRERPGDAKIEGGARKSEKDSEGMKECKRDRVKRLRSEKEGRMAAAREAGWVTAE